MALLPNLTLLPFLLYYFIQGGFHRTFAMGAATIRGRLLLRTTGPVPLGTCIFSNVETIHS